MTKRYELCILRGSLANNHFIAELTGIRFRVEDYPSFSRAVERLLSFKAFGLVQPHRIAALDPTYIASLNNSDTSLGGIELKDSFATLSVRWESYLDGKERALFPLFRRVVVNLKPTRYEWISRPDASFTEWAERFSIDVQKVAPDYSSICSSNWSDQLKIKEFFQHIDVKAKKRDGCDEAN